MTTDKGDNVDEDSTPARRRRGRRDGGDAEQESKRESKKKQSTETKESTKKKCKMKTTTTEKSSTEKRPSQKKPTARQDEASRLDRQTSTVHQPCDLTIEANTIVNIDGHLRNDHATSPDHATGRARRQQLTHATAPRPIERRGRRMVPKGDVAGCGRSTRA